METDMPCLDGGVHDYEHRIIDGVKRAICKKCTHVSQYSLVPSYGDLVNQISVLRKILEDICECRGNLDELIDKARKLLKSL